MVAINEELISSQPGGVGPSGKREVGTRKLEIYDGALVIHGNDGSKIRLELPPDQAEILGYWLSWSE